MRTELIKTYSTSSLTRLGGLTGGGGGARGSSASLGSNSAFGFRANNNNNNNNNVNNSDRRRRKSIVTVGEIPQKDSAYGSYGCFSNWKQRSFKKKNLYKIFPICTWLPEYTVSKGISDLIAGLTVALVLIPQGLAFAAVGGLPPEYGLYSAFIGCFVYIIFGGAMTTTIGPTAIMAIITLNYTQNEPPEYAVLLAFITGVITFTVGALQLGFIVNFISSPVISGFSSASAITICSTQVKALLGLEFEAQGVIEVIKGTIENIDKFSSSDALLSLVCILVLLFLQRLQAICQCWTKFCGPVEKLLWLISTGRSALVVIVCTIIYNLEQGDPPSVGVIGGVPGGLPEIKPPSFAFTKWNNETETEEEYSVSKLISQDSTALLVLPFLALMETYSAAKSFCGTKQIDASQELIAVGLSNLLGSFVSSMPVTGSFSRTTVNTASGAQTPLGGLITGIIVMLSLQFLTDYFYYIPKAALAAVIVSAVIFMVDIGIVYPLWKSKPMDIIPWLVTFLVSVFAGLDIGILAGFLISVLFLLYYAARPGVKVKRGETSSGTQFILVELDRSLTFPSIAYTRHIVIKASSTYAFDTLPIVIDCQHVSFADFTAAQGVRDLVKAFNEKEQEIILWQIKFSIVKVVTGVMEAANIPFKYCETEQELENIIESSSYSKKRKRRSGNVTIILNDNLNGDDDSSTENRGPENENANNNEVYNNPAFLRESTVTFAKANTNNMINQDDNSA